MKDNFKLISDIKKTVIYLDKLVSNFPNNEKVLKDKIMNTIYEVLELIYLTNEVDNRIIYQKKIVSKMKMIDFYIKTSFDKKYISYKKYNKVCGHLLDNLRLIYGWIKYEKSRVSIS